MRGFIITLVTLSALHNQIALCWDKISHFLWYAVIVIIQKFSLSLYSGNVHFVLSLTVLSDFHKLLNCYLSEMKTLFSLPTSTKSHKFVERKWIYYLGFLCFVIFIVNLAINSHKQFSLNCLIMSLSSLKKILKLLCSRNQKEKNKPKKKTSVSFLSFMHFFFPESASWL